MNKILLQFNLDHIGKEYQQKSKENSKMRSNFLLILTLLFH